MLEARRWHIPVFAELLLLLVVGGANQSALLLFKASGLTFAAAPPAPGGAELFPVAAGLALAATLSVLAVIACGARLLFALLLILVLPLKLLEDRHTEAAA